MIKKVLLNGKSQAVYIPDLFFHKEITSFFKDFYLKNKEIDSIRTFAFWARELTWPVSFLNETIKGKKQMSFPRLLQFCRHFGLDVVELECLMCLMLRNTEDPFLAQYSKKITETYYNSDKWQEASPNIDLFNSWEPLCVHSALVFNNGIRDDALISRFLSGPEPLSTKHIDSILSTLEKKKIVKKQSGLSYEILNKSIFIEISSPEEMKRFYPQAYLNHFLNYFQTKPELKSLRRKLSLSADQAQELRVHLQTLKNLIAKTDAGFDSQSDQKLATFYSMNFIPLCAFQKLSDLDVDSARSHQSPLQANTELR